MNSKKKKELSLFWFFVGLCGVAALAIYLIGSAIIYCHNATSNYLLQREVRDPDALITLVDCQIGSDMRYSGKVSYIRPETKYVHKKGALSEGFYVIFDVEKQLWKDVPINQCITEHTEKTLAELSNE